LPHRTALLGQNNYATNSISEAAQAATEDSMRISSIFAFVCFAAISASAQAASLDTQVTAQDGWTAWQVPKVAGSGEPCCFDINQGGVNRIGCDLDGRNWSVSISGVNSRSEKPAASDFLTVYAQVTGGKVAKLRAYSATCPVQTRGPLHKLDDVDPAQSVAWLERQLAARPDKKGPGDEVVTALAFHAAPAGLQALERIAGPAQSEDLRESALFWLGQARGEAGLAVVERYLRDDPDEDIRRHAVFVLSEAKEYDTYPRILAVAHNDRSGEVRSQALFWMAQMQDPRAGQDILATLGTEKDESVREQAVFALSQLSGGAGDKALISVLRGDYPREVKQKALFWLGQSGSDEAMAFLDSVLR
jgi:HEAT repeats